MPLLVGASPPELKQAELLVARFQFQQAQSVLARARRTSALDRESLLRIVELQGIVAGQQRQSAVALSAFTTLLTLDPERRLDKAYAPRVMTPFLEAGQVVKDQGALQAIPVQPVVEAHETKLGVAVPVDALELVEKVRFHVRQATGWERREAGLVEGSATVVVGNGVRAWWAEVLGRDEAQLLLVGSSAAPLEVEPLANAPSPDPAALPQQPPQPQVALPGPQAMTAPPVAEPTDSGSTARTASYFVLGGALVAGAVGGTLGALSAAEFSNLRSPTRNGSGVITELTQVEATQRAQVAARQGLMANVLLVGAGAAAVTGVIMFIVGGARPKPIAIAVTPVGLQVVGAFP